PAIALGLAIAWLGTVFSSGSMAVHRPVLGLNRQIGLSVLLLLPLALIAFSYVIQPALVDRYSLPAVAGLAPAVAWLFARLPWRWTLLAVLVFLGQGGWQLHDQALSKRATDRETQNLLETLEKNTDSELVLFESPAQQYPV